VSVHGRTFILGDMEQRNSTDAVDTPANLGFKVRLRLITCRSTPAASVFDYLAAIPKALLDPAPVTFSTL